MKWLWYHYPTISQVHLFIIALRLNAFYPKKLAYWLSCIFLRYLQRHLDVFHCYRRALTHSSKNAVRHFVKPCRSVEFLITVSNVRWLSLTDLLQSAQHRGHKSCHRKWLCEADLWWNHVDKKSNISKSNIRAMQRMVLSLNSYAMVSWILRSVS